MLDKVKNANQKVHSALISYIQYIKKFSKNWNHQESAIAQEYLINLYSEASALSQVQNDLSSDNKHCKFLIYYQIAIQSYIKNTTDLSFDNLPSSFTKSSNTLTFDDKEIDLPLLNSYLKTNEPAPIIDESIFLNILDAIEKKADTINHNLNKLLNNI